MGKSQGDDCLIIDLEIATLRPFEAAPASHVVDVLEASISWLSMN